MAKELLTAQEILDEAALKMSMLKTLIGVYPPKEGLGEKATQGLYIFLDELEKEIEEAGKIISQSVGKNSCSLALVKK